MESRNKNDGAETEQNRSPFKKVTRPLTVHRSCSPGVLSSDLGVLGGVGARLTVPVRHDEAC